MTGLDLSAACPSRALVSMVDTLIQESGHPRSGFYLYAFDDLAGVIEQNEKAGQKTLLVGVTFALLDFAEKYPMPLFHTVVMETEVEELGAFEKMMADYASRQDVREKMKGYADMYTAGKREVYRVV